LVVVGCRNAVPRNGLRLGDAKDDVEEETIVEPTAKLKLPRQRIFAECRKTLVPGPAVPDIGR
jgi:hypothetical protein